MEDMIQNEIKILMIDDDEEDFLIVRDIILRGVVHHKYTIDWRPSFDSGLKAISEKAHDVYLVDYKLGGRTGLELIKKALDLGCEAPLIILTGENNFEIDKQAMSAGAADYLVKGTISSQVMERSIRYAIANAKHRNEMNELNAALEKRVRSRTIILEETLEKLERSQNELIKAKNNAEHAAKIAEEAAKAKSHFLSNMSHEIRTPMNAIIGFTKVLLETPLTEKQKEYLTTIKVSGDILIVLINDILDLAKVESGKMTFESSPFYLYSSISEVLQLFETKISEQNLELITEYDHSIPDVLVGDPVRLNQIMLNLVGNAVKFTSKGHIKVSISKIKDDAEQVTIRFDISDTGVGIPESDQKNIFEKFQQAGNTGKNVSGGTGLGLAIVKQLVELQGGRISVSSEINKGSTFSFLLSFKKTQEKIEHKPEAVEGPVLAEGAITGSRILLVEDIRPNQLLIKTLLEKYKCVIDIADNGRIAIEKLYDNSYDVVLMDLQMPEMNGIEATEYIRKIMQLDIPVIALTADVTTMNAKKCKTLGMNDYISKPVDEKILYSKILKFINRKSNEAGIAKGLEQSSQAINQAYYSEYLVEITNGDPRAITEIVSAYLEEIPQLTSAIRTGIEIWDWKMIQRAAHSIVPCFALMGIEKEYEFIARTIEEYAAEQQHPEKLRELFYIIDEACKRRCDEIKREFIK
ncbi:MAG: response regulator [Bacteroidia bacterium]